MKKRLAIVTVVTVCLMLIPLLAMQFSEEVQWGLFDFVLMGGLVFVAGMIFATGLSRLKDRKQQLIFGVTMAAIFLYIWAELAVGVFTNLGS